MPELEWKMTAGVLNQTRLRPNINWCQKGVSNSAVSGKAALWTLLYRCAICDCLSFFNLVSVFLLHVAHLSTTALSNMESKGRDFGTKTGGIDTFNFNNDKNTVRVFALDVRSSPRSPEIEPSNMLRLRALIVLAFVASASALLPAQTVPRSASLGNKLDAAPR